MRRLFTVLMCLLVAQWAGNPVWAADAAKSEAAKMEFFEKKIRPVLVERCYECHSVDSKKIKGDLLLDSRPGLLKGGSSGPAMVPGKPEKSLLIKALQYKDQELQMPPKKQLPADQIKDFVTWIKMGAPDPRKEPTIIAGKTNSYVVDFEASKKFWSIQPVKEPTLPTVKNSKWVKSPIDQFILAKLEAKQLKPNPRADKRTLIRRATFDLTGLPPTPEEVDSFLQDKSPKSFEKLVDRLLASPAYGER